ncbi:putative hemin transport protein|uniref:Putative hemin transport protein n=1 Tax=Brenneria salicis ATCC 15712 = DSM 30166 TaxID=714314 RepID=A0A366I4R3_9GAMM|nr:ChuX/HutX family heme-like substrate-binding protein [Brenneria salicis]NMN91940.1 putative hemin transport protein [Brenneria salicis ATCC 15712 = DSM 30166]RBP62839.1 putative hemin transport protein [Brenneria salicis ATCC 15712 = DSM 30166]RLM30712.1 hemin transporter [Brenneria salicis ATCC 15712 = DSM 30166]
MQTSIYQLYLQAKIAHPRKYARDLATLLGISEAELTQARVGQDAQRFQGDAKSWLNALEQVGNTKSITRNDYAVHEHVGYYQNQSLDGHAGLILNPRGLGLRLFLHQWASAFALRETTPRGERQSIQFFDHQGDAILKVYATETTQMSAWRQFIETFVGTDNPPLTIRPAAGQPTAIAAATAHPQLEADWRAMTDVHQFFMLLKRYNLTRQQAFRAVSDELAYRVSNDALSQILLAAQEAKNEIMVFVGNRGCVQIFTGEIERVERMAQHAEWINVFNQDFTLHLIEDAIAESWVTRKPTADGIVTSLELYAADGTQIAQLFGQRTEGSAEQQQWREQINALKPLKELAA